MLTPANEAMSTDEETEPCSGCESPLTEAGVYARIASAPGKPPLCEACYEGIEFIG